MPKYHGYGTVVRFPDFDPEADAEAIRQAMKGFDTDEQQIIDVLSKRTNSQRVEIGIVFKQLYGKDIIDDLKSELSGNFEDAIIAVMTPLYDYLATEVHRAMCGAGTDEGALIEILCTRSNEEIWAICESYNRLYEKTLEDAIKGDTSGYFQRLLVSSCTGARSEEPADLNEAVKDANELVEAGSGQWGTDESTFNAILCCKSYDHLEEVFVEYKKLTGSTIVEAIESEMSGDLKAGMLAVAKSVENRPAYFAERLYESMKGMGTDDKSLIRIIVSRCEIDMQLIKEEYKNLYETAVEDSITNDTSGDYKRLLVALVSN